MMQLLTEAYNDWVSDRVPQMAAGLAYYTVFSLAPLLLIAVGIAGLVLGQEAAREGIREQVTAVLGPQSAGVVTRMMGDASQSADAGLISTIVGFVTLLVAAVAVLGQLKFALNAVWDVPPRSDQSWWTMIRQYLINFALVVATGFLLLVSLIATALVGAATSTARSWLAGPDALWAAVDVVVGLAMAAAVFALVFRTVPDADVEWDDVWVGAAFTAVLFTAGRMALGWYLGRESMTSAYSAAGSLVALLAWVYYSSQIVLFGAEFTHAWARRFGSRTANATHQPHRI